MGFQAQIVGQAWAQSTATTAAELRRRFWAVAGHGQQEGIHHSSEDLRAVLEQETAAVLFGVILCIIKWLGVVATQFLSLSVNDCFLFGRKSSGHRRYICLLTATRLRFVRACLRENAMMLEVLLREAKLNANVVVLCVRMCGACVCACVGVCVCVCV